MIVADLFLGLIYVAISIIGAGMVYLGVKKGWTYEVYFGIAIITVSLLGAYYVFTGQGDAPSAFISNILNTEI